MISPMTTPLETVTLVDEGHAVVHRAPSRGGMATRFSTGSGPVFFLDEASLVDETKNVRGGNPVLFPSPGPLAGDRFTSGGRSGSMKQHIESVAMLVDVFSRALEQAGVACEVLGFTTGAWNGGRAQRDWLRAGRPVHPGRLNEVCRMVFKDADTPWRRARPDIAALLKSDLFREGIDGEAVDWACARLERRSEARRILIVVSDGSPMDAATNLANDPHYLDHHLREVVDRRERQGKVEICGVGVGLDLRPYYRHSQVIDLAGALGNEVFNQVAALIGSRGRARRAA